MSLREMQSALAAVFTESDARERLATNANTFARKYGLDARDLQQLNALSTAAIATYVETLVRKRRGEAARYLPRTQRELGRGFVQAFDTWARSTTTPPGRHAALKDAVAFCRHARHDGTLLPKQREAVRSDLREAIAFVRRTWFVPRG
jgi:hypothetical protein